MDKLIVNKKLILALSVIIVLAVSGTYMGLAAPSNITERKGTISDFIGYFDVPVTLSFPKTSFMLRFDFQGSGSIYIMVYDLNGLTLWYSGVKYVTSGILEVESSWLQYGECYIKVTYVNTIGEYNLTVIAKGSPF